MQRFFREWAVPAFNLSVKAITAFRTGLDTLIVSGAFAPEVSTIQFMNAVLYTLLIDMVFTGLWLYIAYGGSGKEAQIYKFFAVVGAWTLYIGMLVLGWSAHPEAPFLALLGRVAGGIALGYDSWTWIAGPIRGSLIKFMQWVKHLFSGDTPEEAYQKLFDRELIKALRTSSPEVRTIVGSVVKERIGLELPGYVLNALPFPGEGSGNKSNDDEDDRPARPLRVSSAIARAWLSCRENLEPEEMFRRDTIEQCTDLGKSRASEIINYAISLSEVERIGHGVYIFRPVSDIPIVEQKPSDENPGPPTTGYTAF